MSKRERYAPFILTAAVILLDQITKALVVAYIPENTVQFTLLGGWRRLVHVRNTAVAFSMGTELPYPVKVILFIALPLLLMAGIILLLVLKRYDGLVSRLLRGTLAGSLAGGLGNLIDRIFRSLRVVDFISMKMSGFLGMEWFPTYNIADASVTISVILLILSLVFSGKRDQEVSNE